MTLAELATIRPDLADFHYAGCIVDGVYLDEETGRWTAIVMHTCDGSTSMYWEARCHPSCIRACDRPYVWVDETHVCCPGCIADLTHRYQTVHE